MKKLLAKITSLSAGEYTVTVTDADGSTASISVTVTDEYPATVDPLVLTTSFVDDTKTQGTSTAFVEVKGGTAPYSYKWNNGKTTAEITSLVAGEYTVTVTDADGSTATKSVTVTDEYPATIEPIAITATLTDALSVSTGGSISLTVSGGTSPYTYAWDNGASTHEIFMLSAGTYSVTVTDAAGAHKDSTFTINEVKFGYEISGSMSVNGAAPAGGELTLIKKTGESYEFVQSQAFTSGEFAFSGLSQATYILLALPSGNSAGQFLPSYYAKASQWTGATEIAVAYNVSGLKFELQAYPKALTGSGTVSGSVVADFTAQEEKPYTSNNVVSVPVYLIQNNAVVAVDYTDADGSYSFVNVPTGSYSVQYDVAGNRSAAVAVLLTADAPSVTDLKIDAKTETSDKQIVAAALNIHPQPAANYFVIDYSVQIQSLTVVSNSGIIAELPVLAGNYVDLSSLPSGHYTAHFDAGQGAKSFNFVKQ